MQQTLLKEIMKTPVIIVRIGDPFRRVEEKLRVHGIRHLPVIDSRSKVVGIITQRDLYRIISPRKTDDGDFTYDPQSLDSFILKRVMTPNPALLGPEDSVAQAVKMMAAGRYGCIPIVGPDKEIVGIVTQTDILRFVARWLHETED